MSAAVERARLRYLVLDMLHGALRESGLTVDEVAHRAGMSEKRARADFDGDGNLTLNAIALYMWAMGLEVRATFVAFDLPSVDAESTESTDEPS